MKVTILYKYDRGDGRMTVSPNKPDVPYTERYRLVADANGAITDGNTVCICTDTEDPSLWRDATVEEVAVYKESIEME